MRPLTPDTSYGFDVIRFARDVLRFPLLPWQEFAVIHAGELLPDGMPRFRKVLIMVARQNGKTSLLIVLTLFWQFVEFLPMILGTSTKLDYAKESWQKGVRLVARTPELNPYHLPGRKWYRETNGEQESQAFECDDDGNIPEGAEPARYKIAASNAEGGRSLTLDRLVLDELRQHYDYSAWDAAMYAGNAVPHFQMWALSNAGSDRSIVLNDLRDLNLAFIETGVGEDDSCHLEWSADEDADPEDLDQLAYANPALGYLIRAKALLAEARQAKAKGGDRLTGFQTEAMCIRVRNLRPALDPFAWKGCLDVGDLADVPRKRIALCLDVAPDEEHATLAAATVLSDGRVRGEIIDAWDGPSCAAALRKALPEHVSRIRPGVVGWLPTGPAAAASAILNARKAGPAGAPWPPPGTKLEPIKGDAPAVCMGFAELVKARQFAHSDDPLLNDQAGAAERLKQGDRWVFSRRLPAAQAPDPDAEPDASGHVDAIYAVAGAAHLARLMAPPVGKPRLIVVSDD